MPTYEDRNGLTLVTTRCRIPTHHDMPTYEDRNGLTLVTTRCRIPTHHDVLATSAINDYRTFHTKHRNSVPHSVTIKTHVVFYVFIIICIHMLHNIDRENFSTPWPSFSAKLKWRTLRTADIVEVICVLESSRLDMYFVVNSKLGADRRVHYIVC